MMIGFSPLLRGIEIKCSAQKDTINNKSPIKMKTNLIIILLIASLSDKPNAFGMQKKSISKILKIIPIKDTPITRLGKIFEAFTIPQTAKS